MRQFKPTLTSIYDRVLTDLAGTAHSSRRVFAKAIAGCSYLLYGYADLLSKNLHPLYANNGTLDDWAAIWLEDGRKLETKASGIITVVAVEEIDLPTGTIFQYQDLEYGAVEFETIQDEKFSGSKDIWIRAVLPGKIKVIASGQLLQSQSTIAGMKPEAVVKDQIDGGTDTESDEALRERIRDRVRNPPQGGSPQDYIVWAKVVPGISRAWVAPRIQGPGTVGVAFVDDQSGGLPTQAATRELLKKLSQDGPAATRFVSVDLEPRPVDFKILIEPYSLEVAERIKSELATLIRVVSEPVASGSSEYEWLNSRGKKTRGVLTTADIHDALSLVPKDRYRVVLPDPESDTLTEPGQIMTLGRVTVDSYQ